MKRSILTECIRQARARNTPRGHPCWNGFKHYSFIVQNNTIIEMGVNRKGKNPTFVSHFGATSIHAETDAYRKAKGILNSDRKFEVVNIRLNKAGELRNSAPCQFCFRFLKFLDCHAIYFSTDAGVIAKVPA